jgi:hypothetical protein
MCIASNALKFTEVRRLEPIRISVTVLDCDDDANCPASITGCGNPEPLVDKRAIALV